jgi:hypothetical protein
MSSKLKFLVFSGILMIICLNFLIPAIVGTIDEKTKSTIADKDTYVDEENANLNYGTAISLKSGFSSSGKILESYFHFSFSDKPSDIIKAELSLDFWDVTQTMNLTVSIIEVSWNELTMTWMNKPTHSGIIGLIKANSSDTYKLDITNVLTSRTEISLCVNMTLDLITVLDSVFIKSREGSYHPSEAPQIIWTYSETESDDRKPFIPSYNLFLIIGLIAIIGIQLMKKIRYNVLN